MIEPSRTESPESIRKRQGVTPEVGFSIIIPHIPRTSLRSVNTQRHGSEVSPPPAPIPEILISHQQMVKDTRVDAVELLRFQSRSEEGEEAEHEQAVFQRQLQEALDLSILDTKLNSSESTPPNVSPSWTSSGTLFPTLTQEIFPQSLLPLLSISGHPAAALDFTSFVRHPPSPFALAADVHEASWDKIGEASYSEVFRSWGKNGEELVIKIIPISDGTELAREDGELPYLSEYAAVMREIEVGKLLGGSDDNGNEGFVRFEGAFVVQGAYPPHLLDQWDAFRAAQKPPCDDQIRPSVLPDDQVYAVICLAHAGSELETYKLASWSEALDVLLQTAHIVARGEKNFQLEHRDLHWGNVLVRPVPVLDPNLPISIASLSLESTTASSTKKIEVTLIDFTLSRATNEDGTVMFDAFEDECIFEGEGDYQFDIYRMMRDYVKSDWEGFHPLTNLMWLHYLSTKLLEHKKLKAPSARASAPPPSPFRPSRQPLRSRRGNVAAPPFVPSDIREEKAAYDTLIRLDKLLKDAVEQGLSEKLRKGKKGKNGGRTKRGTKESIDIAGEMEVGWRSANDVWNWWLEQK